MLYLRFVLLQPVEGCQPLTLVHSESTLETLEVREARLEPLEIRKSTLETLEILE